MNINNKAKILLEYVHKTTGDIVEIGSIRSPTIDHDDGYSTLFFAQYANLNQRHFVSYDIEPKNVEIANKVLRDEGLKECVKLGDGKSILPTFGPISFLYLDSHRLPAYSLQQYQAAELAENSIVAIDDAHTFDGNEYGKATFLVQLFEKIGVKWELKETQPGYRMVIAHFPFGKKSGSVLRRLMPEGESLLENIKKENKQ